MSKWTGILLASLLIASALQVFAQDQPFTDVPQSHWAAKAIQRLAAEGIVEGVSAARFDGKRPITRYEVAMALARMLDKIDAKPSGPAAPTLEQIRQMILTDQQVQKALQGPEGKQGQPGKEGPQGRPGERGATGATGATGEPGKQGERGAQGERGLQGPPGKDAVNNGGAGQLTAQELADIRKLLTTFGPEIAAIRGDIRALTGRLEKVEAEVAKISPIRASVAAGMRMGDYGTKLGFRSGDAAENNTDLQAMWNSGYPDLAKDALKGSRFGVSRVDIELNGAITQNVAMHADVRAITPLTFDALPYNGTDAPILFDGQRTYLGGAYGDTVQLWDWYATFNTAMLSRDVTVTAGKHTSSIAEGLLVDTNRAPLLGVSLDSGNKPFTYGINASLVDRALLDIDPATPQDFYGYAYLGWDLGNWNLVGTLLPRGFADERGWSLGAEGDIAGIHVFGEAAHMIPPSKHFFSGFFSGDAAGDFNSYSALFVGADVLNNWNGLNLTAKYGRLGANYNPTLSALNPYSSINAYDIDWVDRPLFLSQYNVSDGAELDARYTFGKDWLLNARVYTGISDQNAGAADDTVWTISLKKPVAEGVSASVLYGLRKLDTTNVPGLTRTNLQVLRGQLEFAL